VRKLRTRVVIRSADRLLSGLDAEQRLMAERVMRELSDFRSRGPLVLQATLKPRTKGSHRLRRTDDAYGRSKLASLAWASTSGVLMHSEGLCALGAVRSFLRFASNAPMVVRCGTEIGAPAAW
jgi:hypothetical protein